MTDHIELIIGRAQGCHIRVDDEYASPQHARLVIYADRTITLEDLGSTNGTRVGLGGTFVKVYGPTVIGLGFTIRVGRTDLAVAALLRAAADMNQERSQ